MAVCGYALNSLFPSDTRIGPGFRGAVHADPFSLVKTAGGAVNAKYPKSLNGVYTNAAFALSSACSRIKLS